MPTGCYERTAEHKAKLSAANKGRVPWSAGTARFIKTECDTCGAEFNKPIGKVNDSLKKGQKTNYCSRECASKRHESVIVLSCGYCARAFEVSGKRYRYNAKNGQRMFFCSKMCSGAWVRAENAAREESASTKACRLCKQVKPIEQFPKRKHGTRNECLECTRTLRHDWAKRGGWIKKRQSNSKRRAQKRLTSVGNIDFKSIIARDKFLCYLCGEPVDARDIEFDHVIPLSKGGPHIKENIRVTHSLCNQRKRDKLLSELDWVSEHPRER